MSTLFISFLSFFFLSFFLSFFSSSSDKHSSKTILCMRILYIPNDCSTTGHLPFLVRGGVRATTGKLRQRNGPPVCKTLAFVDFCLRIPGVARIVRPQPDYWKHVAVCDEFATRQLLVSRSSTIVISIYLILKINLVQWKTPLCIQISFESPQCESACFWRWVALTIAIIST